MNFSVQIQALKIKSKKTKNQFNMQKTMEREGGQWKEQNMNYFQMLVIMNTDFTLITVVKELQLCTN